VVIQAPSMNETVLFSACLFVDPYIHSTIHGITVVIVLLSCMKQNYFPSDVNGDSSVHIDF